MNAPRGGYRVNLCYCDETGTGDEPIAVMVGVVVDASRMHLTKAHWQTLLDNLSNAVGRQVVELHTRDFYKGNGIWKDMPGEVRSQVINDVVNWIAERKHHVVYTSVLKTSYKAAFGLGHIPDELNTIWRYLGFHLVLAMQRYCQPEKGVKGHTVFVFDNEERERMRFTDLIARPPVWSDGYYKRPKKAEQLDQIVDVPYFGDSQEVVLVQLADMLALLLRRYAEIKEGLIPPRYADEEVKVTDWVERICARCIGRAHVYPSTGREKAAEMFFQHAPPSLRVLG